MTRPNLGWSDLPGRRVGIYGLGVEGRVALHACRARGIEPVLVDDAPRDDGDLGAPVLRTASGGLLALQRCEVVIKTPGISRYGETVRAIASAGAAVVGGLGLWLAEADRARVLLVTGTKGKSTTTSIAGHLLSHWGYRVFTGGNLGTPPYDPDLRPDFDYWVIEVSSYQATDLAVSPPVTAVTSLGPDHLPWHDHDVETYYRDKLSATSQPGSVVTVANGDDETIRAHAALLGPEVWWVSGEDEPGAPWPEQLGLVGAHNRRNALIAARALRAMRVPEASDPDAWCGAAQGFSGLPSRLQTIGRLGDIAFVDDSLSTNVLSTLAAIGAFADRRVAVLVGGQSRSIDYTALGVGLRSREKPLLLVTMPTNGREIRAQVEQVDSAPHLEIDDADSLVEAVRLATDWALPDGVVLLSPAAPSFDLFANYAARARAFADAARLLDANVVISDT